MYLLAALKGASLEATRASGTMFNCVLYSEHVVIQDAEVCLGTLHTCFLSPTCWFLHYCPSPGLGPSALLSGSLAG